MFFVLALAVGLIVVLGVTIALARRIESSTPEIDRFNEFRDALRPALARIDDAADRSARRRDSLGDSRG
ncbi:MAG: hypothetical protein ACOYN3_07820 [Acidimicrobiia bacterium]